MFRTLLIRCETRECLGNIVSQKKVKRAGSAAFMASASELEKTAEALPKAADVKTQVPSSLDNMIQNITPAQLEEIERRVTASTEREERLLNEDNLFQMEVSAQGSSPGKAPRVFWKTVTLAPDSVQTTFYTVLLDGRRVKAFETKRPLLLPTREYADAVRQEWASQEGFVNKSLMPLTDIASAASYHVGASGVAPRIDYLMGFLRNDSSFFFQEETYKEQEELVGSAHAWFEKMYQIQCPRVERLKYPNVPESGVRVVREALQALGMNTYQAVSLCILCQYTASLVLPLALLLTGGRAITTQNMIRASTIEERYNIGAHKQIEGYHDIRQSDANTKMAASVYAWRLTEGLTHDQCIPAADSE